MEGGRITVSVTPNPGTEPGARLTFSVGGIDALLPTMRSGVRAAGSVSGPATVEVMAVFSVRERSGRQLIS